MIASYIYTKNQLAIFKRHYIITHWLQYDGTKGVVLETEVINTIATVVL